MKYIILFIIAALALASCSSAEKKADISPAATDYTAASNAFMPLSIGNKWSYVVNYIGFSGETTIEIIKKDGDWFIDNKGNALKNDQRGIRDRQRYLLQFPLTENNQWVSIISPVQTETRRIVSSDTPVETPAGTFEGAISVETVSQVAPGRILKSVTYFVPKVGIVKIETALEDHKKGEVLQQTVTQLTSYSLNKSKN